MIDFASYLEYQPPGAPLMGDLRQWNGEMECTCPECRARPSATSIYRFNWDKHNRYKKMSDEQYLLCPPRLLGYAMSHKTWAQLEISKLQEPKPSSVNTFENELQLDPEAKDLIKKSVLAHEMGKKTDSQGRTQNIEDFTQGKGKGLTIMLYGRPYLLTDLLFVADCDKDFLGLGKL